MVGSGSAAYGQGWDMDAIAACVVGGVSLTSGAGKISGVTVGVLIFTALTSCTDHSVSIPTFSLSSGVSYSDCCHS